METNLAFICFFLLYWCGIGQTYNSYSEDFINRENPQRINVGEHVWENDYMENTESYYDILIRNAKEYYDMLPDSIRESIPNFFTSISLLKTADFKYKHNIKPIKNILQALRNGILLSPTVAKELVDTVKDKTVDNYKHQIYEALTTRHVMCDDSVISAMKNSLKNMANHLLIASAVHNFIFLVQEANAFWIFWDTIKDAQNFIPSSIEKRQGIAESLARIPDELNKLNNFIGNLSEELIRNKANRQIRKIERLLHKIDKEIRDLKILVNDKTTQLANARDSSKKSMFLNTVTGTTTAIFTYAMASQANPGLLILNGLLATGSFCLAIANAERYFISADVLHTLRKELDKLDELENKRQSFEEEFDIMSEEVSEAIDDWAQ